MKKEKLLTETRSLQCLHVDGGQKEFGETYARSAISNFVDGLFIEVHDNPDEALSDGTSSLDLKDLTQLLEKVLKITI